MESTEEGEALLFLPESVIFLNNVQMHNMWSNTP